MAQEPWEVRPKQERGDPTPNDIYLEVGMALSAWEIWESRMAELFDALVAAHPSNRAAFAAFISVKTPSARTEMVDAAFRQAKRELDALHDAVEHMINAFSKFGARRNEIAHGRIYNLGEFGYYLGPNNVMPRKWTDEGIAKYQYTSADVRHYRECFTVHSSDCDIIAGALNARASDKIRRTRPSRPRRDTET